MTTRPCRRILLSLLTVGLAFAPCVVAEVSAGSLGGPDRGVVLMSGGSSIDPSPWPGWRSLRLDLDPRQILNPDAVAPDDGQPDFAVDPLSGDLVVVWSSFLGSSHEIVLSRWNGHFWTEWEQLTSNAQADRDPAVFFSPDGTMHLSWWRTLGDGTPAEIWYLQRLPGTTGPGELEERVTRLDEDGRLPDIAWQMDTPIDAYQRSLGGIHAVHLSRRISGIWETRQLGESTYFDASADGTTDLEIRLHSERGRLWITWQDAEARMAYRIHDPDDTGEDRWGPIEYYDYDPRETEEREIVREFARKQIKRMILPRR